MRYYSDNSIAAIMPMRLTENTSWKVLAYGIYTRVVFVSSNVCEVALSMLQEKAGILASNSHTSVVSDWTYHFLTCKKPRSRF